MASRVPAVLLSPPCSSRWWELIRGVPQGPSCSKGIFAVGKLRYGAVRPPAMCHDASWGCKEGKLCQVEKTRVATGGVPLASHCPCAAAPSWSHCAFPWLGQEEALPCLGPGAMAGCRYKQCRNWPRGEHIWGPGSVLLPTCKLLTLFPEALGLSKQATVISFLQQTTHFWHHMVI